MSLPTRSDREDNPRARLQSSSEPEADVRSYERTIAAVRAQRALERALSERALLTRLKARGRSRVDACPECDAPKTDIVE